jgi:hypothetical protein
MNANSNPPAQIEFVKMNVLTVKPAVTRMVRRRGPDTGKAQHTASVGLFVCVAIVTLVGVTVLMVHGFYSVIGKD